MPELTQVVMATCKSNRDWSTTVAGSKGNRYTVRFERVDEEIEGVLYDYTCTCPSFRYRRGYCKHIALVKNQRCGWDQLIHGPGTFDGFDCPGCGGVVKFYRCGV